MCPELNASTSALLPIVLNDIVYCIDIDTFYMIGCVLYCIVYIDCVLYCIVYFVLTHLHDYTCVMSCQSPGKYRKHVIMN